MHKNPDDKVAYDKAYHEANRERIHAKKAEYYQKNRQKVLAKVKQYAEANPEKVKANVRQWHEANRDYVHAYDAGRYTGKRRAAQLRNNQERYRKYPERTRVNDLVYRAVKAGMLIPLPCWVCGKEKTEAHHANYDAPLDVVWLCRSHHRQLHAEV